MSNHTKEQLEEAARDWEQLAASQDHEISRGNRAAAYRQGTYLDTAKSIRLEIETGVPHCACCLKPTNKKKG